MEPLFFGPAEHSLFGWLHLPSGRAPRRTGVVLCHPFGQEFVLAHRAFHGFARLLADSGFATLRFDWWGTGDSHGDLEEVRLETWMRDVGLAIRTVRERVHCDDVALVGMRLGATLAALAGAREQLAALVLWDPVVDGAAFLHELAVAHWRETHRSGSPPEKFDAPLAEASGFPLSDRLREDLRALDLRAAELDRDVPVLWAATDRSAAAVHADLPRAWKERGLAIEKQPFPAPAVWEEDEQRVLVPRLALEGAVRWMEAAC
jgi:alpha-beta hydrolase superfamily lysophospholipase